MVKKACSIDLEKPRPWKTMKYAMVSLGVAQTWCPEQLKAVTLTCKFRVRVRCSSNVEVSRQQVLEKVDRELAKGDDRAALSLVKDLQGKPGGLHCFGSARQVSLVLCPLASSQYSIFLFCV